MPSLSLFCSSGRFYISRPTVSRETLSLIQKKMSQCICYFICFYMLLLTFYVSFMYNVNLSGMHIFSAVGFPTNLLT